MDTQLKKNEGMPANPRMYYYNLTTKYRTWKIDQTPWKRSNQPVHGEVLDGWKAVLAKTDNKKYQNGLSSTESIEAFGDDGAEGDSSLVVTPKPPPSVKKLQFPVAIEASDSMSDFSPSAVPVDRLNNRTEEVTMGRKHKKDELAYAESIVELSQVQQHFADRLAQINKKNFSSHKNDNHTELVLYNKKDNNKLTPFYLNGDNGSVALVGITPSKLKDVHSEMKDAAAAMFFQQNVLHFVTKKETDQHSILLLYDEWRRRTLSMEDESQSQILQETPTTAAKGETVTISSSNPQDLSETLLKVYEDIHAEMALASVEQASNLEAASAEIERLQSLLLGQQTRVPDGLQRKIKNQSTKHNSRQEQDAEIASLRGQLKQLILYFTSPAGQHQQQEIDVHREKYDNEIDKKEQHRLQLQLASMKETVASLEKQLDELRAVRNKAIQEASLAQDELEALREKNGGARSIEHVNDTHNQYQVFMLRNFDVVQAEMAERLVITQLQQYELLELTSPLVLQRFVSIHEASDTEMRSLMPDIVQPAESNLHKNNSTDCEQNIEQKVAEMIDKRREMSECMGAMQGTIDDLVAENQTLKRKSESAVRAAEDARRSTIKCEADLEALREAYKEDAASFHKERTDLLNHIMRLQEESVAETDSFERQKKEMQQVIESQRNDFSEELDHLRQKVHDETLRADEAGLTIEGLNKTIHILNQEVASERNALSRARTAANESHIEEIENVRQQKEALSRQLSIAQDDIASLKVEREENRRRYAETLRKMQAEKDESERLSTERLQQKLLEEGQRLELLHRQRLKDAVDAEKRRMDLEVGSLREKTREEAERRHNLEQRQRALELAAEEAAKRKKSEEEAKQHTIGSLEALLAARDATAQKYAEEAESLRQQRQEATAALQRKQQDDKDGRIRSMHNYQFENGSMFSSAAEMEGRLLELERRNADLAEEKDAVLEVYRDMEQEMCGLATREALSRLKALEHEKNAKITRHKLDQHLAELAADRSSRIRLAHKVLQLTANGVTDRRQLALVAAEEAQLRLTQAVKEREARRQERQSHRLQREAGYDSVVMSEVHSRSHSAGNANSNSGSPFHFTSSHMSKNLRHENTKTTPREGLGIVVPHMTGMSALTSSREPSLSSSRLTRQQAQPRLQADDDQYADRNKKPSQQGLHQQQDPNPMMI